MQRFWSWLAVELGKRAGLVALLSALVVPPLLVWAERRGWVSRGLIKEPAPFIETPCEHTGHGAETAAAAET